MNYKDYGLKMMQRIKVLLAGEGLAGIPTRYDEFSKLDKDIKKIVGRNLPLVLSDNYEHFMACLPGKEYAAQHVLVRKQIGGFTVAAGFWRWLDFLSRPITEEDVELAADFFSGRHNQCPRRFNKDYWLHVANDCGGYLPIQIRCVGEGAVFTGVPFPIAEIYGEKPAVWANEPIYIQIGHLCFAATTAAQFAEALGGPGRFIEVAFRALQTQDFSDDMLLAILIGGGLFSTSNDLGAFINGAPFKSAGTTGHCYYQQYADLEEALKELLNSPLGPYCTVLLDVYRHEHGFEILRKLIREGCRAPFAERPDSGETLKLGMSDLAVLEDEGVRINSVFEDGYKPANVLEAEIARKQHGFEAERILFGAGGAFTGPRSSLETAYKACFFHNGKPGKETEAVETMKICLNDEMKQSIPGRVEWFQNEETGIFMLGCLGEKPPAGYKRHDSVILYDGLTDPGNPYFCPDYDPVDLAECRAVQNGRKRSEEIRKLLGRDFAESFKPNKSGIALSGQLKRKRGVIYQRALKEAGERV